MMQTLGDKVSRLCETEGLVNIAPAGTATQSSTSRWSQPNDPQRAVQDLNVADFAFHTLDEDDAWWAMDFEAPSRISYIIVENRKKLPFQDKAYNLRVEIETPGIPGVEIYAANAPFGASPQGAPLVVPVPGDQQASRIKITRVGSGYFHLSKVSILAPKPDLAEGADTGTKTSAGKTGAKAARKDSTKAGGKKSRRR